MIKTIYGIYDAKAKVFNTFIVTENDINLKRDLTNVVNSGDRNNYLAMCTTDFSLVKLGLINDETGQVENVPQEVVYQLQSLKEEKNG